MGASWQAFYAHLCAASIIRAMPETEIPPAMRGDLYCDIDMNLAFKITFAVIAALTYYLHISHCMANWRNAIIKINTNTAGGEYEKTIYCCYSLVDAVRGLQR